MPVGWITMSLHQLEGAGRAGGLVVTGDLEPDGRGRCEAAVEQCS